MIGPVMIGPSSSPPAAPAGTVRVAPQPGEVAEPEQRTGDAPLLVDVPQHDDGIVNHNTNHQCQRQHSDLIQRESHRIHQTKGRD